MLEEQEAVGVFSELSRLALSHGLNWLITDVQGQIALGKQATQDIEVKDVIVSVDFGTSPQRRAHKASFVVTQPFTEREKLLLLIEALEAASVGLPLGILNTYETIRAGVHDLKGVGFAADVVRAEVLSVTLEALRTKESVLRLEALLRELKDSV
jgi:hypothetical protein